jgi:starch phosphorylase
MKLMMNGALTLGTEDGANLEIHKEVGDDNILIFGMETREVNMLKKNGYNPREYYNNNPKLKRAIDFLSTFSSGSFKELADIFLSQDTYMALADFSDYSRIQDLSSKLYKDKYIWQKMSLINISKSGVFSADRSIEDYAKNIWNVEPLK